VIRWHGVEGCELLSNKGGMLDEVGVFGLEIIGSGDKPAYIRSADQKKKSSV